MRSIADYVADLRALQRVIVAISVEDLHRYFSARYHVSAILERSPASAPSTRGRPRDEFESHRLEIFGTLHSPGDWANLPFAEQRERYRAAAIEFGQAVAAALGVPCYVNPPEADGASHLDWLEQRSCSRLAALLAESFQVLILSGRGFAPIDSATSGRYADLKSSAEARLEYWTQKLAAWQALESWKAKRGHERGEDPYLALVELQRRGKLSGVIVETPFGHLQTAGLHDECVAEIHGSLAEVECLACHHRAPAAPAIDSFRKLREIPRCSCGGWLKLAVTAWGQAPPPEAIARARRFAQHADLVLVLGSQLTTHPCKQIALDPVRSRCVPLVILSRDPTPVDSMATLIIKGKPERTLPFATTLLG